MTQVITPDVWQLLEPLVDSTLDRDPSEREQFLRDACSDSTIRQQVEQLIRECEYRTPIFDVPALERFAGLLAERNDQPQAVPELLAGRYRIESEIGRGGMATVYRARDARYERPVAVKVLSAGLAAAVIRDRFLAEIRIAANLAHPHVVPLFDHGEEDGLLFYVMPLVDGESLRARIRRNGPLPIDEAIRVAAQAADALGYAHSAGVIHRDIKPENLLYQAGNVLVCDFGIAQAVNAAKADRMTWPGLAVGTAQYMSPEQSDGERALDARTDVFSLGCVLYEMLSGVPPFGDGAAAQSERFRQPPRDVRFHRPRVSEALAAVVHRSLAVERAERFPSAAAFARGLKEAAVEPDEPSQKPDRTPPWKLALWALGVVSAVSLSTIVATKVLGGRAPASDPVVGIPDGDPRRIAVLYFDDLSRDSTLGHIAAGLSEGLMDQLSQVPVLRVTSPNGVRAFRNTDVPFDTIVRRLAAGTVIGGSVSRSGALLRVTVRLIDARTGAQLNSRTLQHPMSSLFRLQDSLTNDVAIWLREHLGRQVRLQAQLATTTSVPAWEVLHRGDNLALQAMDLSVRSDARATELFARADSVFEEAERLDPRWTEPIVRRARNASNRAFVYLENAGRPTTRFSAQLNAAIALADRALARSPLTPEALTIRGEARLRLVSFTNAQPADSLLRLSNADLEKAVAARPDMARAWYALGSVRSQQGRYSDAADAFKTAYESDAFLSNVRAVVSELFISMLFAGRFNEANEWCRTAQGRFAGDPRFTDCRLIALGWAGHTPADVGSAWAALEGIERRDSTATKRYLWSFRRMMVATVLARAQMRDSARAVIARTREEPDESQAALLPEAYVHVLLRENGNAVRILSRYLSISPNFRSALSVHPWFRPLHGDAQFDSLVARPH